MPPLFVINSVSFPLSVPDGEEKTLGGRGGAFCAVRRGGVVINGGEGGRRQTLLLVRAFHERK